MRDETFGEYIKGIREDKLYTLQQISKQLKLDIRQLEAFEKEDFHIFSAYVYARGVFIKYMDFLGIDTTELLPYFQELWKFQHEIKKPISQKNKPFFKKITFPSLPIQTPILLVIGVILIAGISYGIYLKQHPTLVLELPKESTGIVREPFIVIKGIADNRLQLTLNKLPVYIGKDGKFEKNILLEPGINHLTLEAKNSLGVVKTITRYIVHN